MFEKEFKYFIANQEDLVRKHRGKFLVIKGEQIVGVYPSALEAYLSAQKDHEPGTFMIQLCEPGPQAYTVTIASAGLVSFNQ